ncbi:hypothetical protein OHA79_44795 (plasmid) [Streptomyces sp. NBC_00841]|uniref:hypothetical protein n=1 Tax=unclassified Streptomyces TaxID=2593676 RepID=UPI002252AC6C|nr:MULTISPECIES: hypothetical protein [unclassified Streptomyces]MCX4538970.1 hypothetical protein [Streptomyces sp. NBC_01669]WSA04798.1 hypothetical protein OHA79_44795 [Streptomyces sp. NBC_00841]
MSTRLTAAEPQAVVGHSAEGEVVRLVGGGQPGVQRPAGRRCGALLEAIATRIPATNFHGTVTIAAIRLWLRP